MNLGQSYSDVASMEQTACGDERMDVKRRDIINQGLSVQASCNTVSALEFLKAHDIDPDVIERVLTEPQRRRSTRHH